jgi:hypothetical protein
MNSGQVSAQTCIALTPILREIAAGRLGFRRRARRWKEIEYPKPREVHLQLAAHHVLLGFGVEADVAHDGPAHQLGPDELADSAMITVRLCLFWRTISSMIRSGLPTPMNPPVIRLAPSGIMATDWSRGTVCIV